MFLMCSFELTLKWTFKLDDAPCYHLQRRNQAFQPFITYFELFQYFFRLASNYFSWLSISIYNLRYFILIFSSFTIYPLLYKYPCLGITVLDKIFKIYHHHQKKKKVHLIDTGLQVEIDNFPLPSNSKLFCQQPGSCPKQKQL